MKYIVVGIAMCVLALNGCAPSSPSPDQIRHETAKATAAVARNTKAVAQGVFDGLRAKGPININRASKSDLETLPGIDSVAADRIIANRPYKDSGELRSRHIVSKSQYNRIATKIKT